jgi:hypothetical protein
VGREVKDSEMTPPIEKNIIVTHFEWVIGRRGKDAEKSRLKLLDAVRERKTNEQLERYEGW